MSVVDVTPAVRVTGACSSPGGPSTAVTPIGRTARAQPANYFGCEWDGMGYPCPFVWLVKSEGLYPDLTLAD